MDSALILSATLLGLASVPHCAAMCAGPCAVVTSGAAPGRISRSQALRGPGAITPMVAFQAARLFSYACVGALVSSSVGALAALSELAPALRPLWTLLQVAMLALGLWLLWSGQQPAWMASLGRVPKLGGIGPVPGAVGVPGVAAAGLATATAGQAVVFQRTSGRAGLPAADASADTSAVHRQALFKAAAAGALWAGWPCGLLQSALLVAALTGSAASGAAAMGGFALASSLGLILAPWAWRRWLSGGGGLARERALVRLGGLLLAAAAAWALGHGLWLHVARWCGLA
jgi:sulfite exporter TauE/SafE